MMPKVQMNNNSNTTQREDNVHYESEIDAMFAPAQAPAVPTTPLRFKINNQLVGTMIQGKEGVLERINDMGRRMLTKRMEMMPDGPHWCEYQDTNTVSGIAVDFDFYQMSAEPQMKGLDMQELAVECMRFISKQFDIEADRELFHTAILYRPKDRNGKLIMNDKHHLYKDGMHVLVPEIQTSKEVKIWLMNELGKIADQFVAKKRYDFKEGIVDLCSAHFPTLFIGNRKRSAVKSYDHKIYKFSMWHYDDPNGKKGELEEVTSCLPVNTNIVAEMALNTYGIEKVCKKRHYKLTTEASEVCSAWLKEREEKRKKDQEESEKYKPSDEDIKLVADDEKNKHEMLDIIKVAVEALDDERADDTRKWFGVLTTLRTLRDTYELDEEEIDEICVKFSKRSPKFPGDDQVIGAMNATSGNLYLRMLLHFVTVDSPRTAKICRARYLKMCPIKRVFTYFEEWERLLYKDLNNKEVLRTDVTYAEIDDFFRQTIFEVGVSSKTMVTRERLFDHVQNMFVITYKEEKLETLVKTLDKNIRLKFINKDDGKEVVRVEKLGMLLKRAYEDNKLRSFKQSVCIPYNTAENKPEMRDAINVFSGFHIKNHVPKETYEFDESSLYYHICNQLCDDDEASYKYVFGWLAHMIQKPAEVPGTALVFQSLQGNGKDLLGTFISRLVGKNCSDNFDNPEHFFSKFNNKIASLLFVVLNELSDKGNAKQKENHNILKNMITRTEATVEPKGKDMRTVTTYARFAFFTNNENALYVENSDRRFAMFKANNEFVNNRDYFAPIVAEINNPDFIYSAFRWFQELDISDFNVRAVPQTKYKAEQILSNMKSSLRFVKSIFETGSDCPAGFYKRKGGLVIERDAMYAKYAAWCGDTKEIAVPAKTFCELIAQIDLKTTQVKINNAKVRGYVLDKNILLQSFRTYMKMPTFEFDVPPVEEGSDNDEQVNDEEIDE